MRTCSSAVHGPRVTLWSAAPLRRASADRLTPRDCQVAKREKNQSIVSYAMDFLNAVGVHNDTIMVVEPRILEVHRAAKSSMDWTAGGAQFHSPTFYAFLNGLYHNADKDDVIATTDYIHKRIRHQQAFSKKFLMPNTCLPPTHATALGTPD
eukprot:3097516-Pleurochrysis_carterae.AAC.1